MDGETTMCETCEGKGEIAVYYTSGYGCGMGNDEAMRMAGKVHHKETCPDCNGEGEVEDEATGGSANED